MALGPIPGRANFECAGSLAARCSPLLRRLAASSSPAVLRATAVRRGGSKATSLKRTLSLRKTNRGVSVSIVRSERERTEIVRQKRRERGKEREEGHVEVDGDIHP